ncbi:MAG: exodeoxyribonuclease III [Acidobacteria bacterium]|nr:exodeoxyribonuclease III [Acidobacteriota bacterium]
MRIATWNVNSIRVRLPRLLAWLDRRQPDIVCLQETKVVDADFPTRELETLGYRSLVNGQKTYNGVAILSRGEASDCYLDFRDGTGAADRRLCSAMIAGIRIVNVYVPNGSEVGSEKYAYKLAWYSRLRTFLDTCFDPGSDVLVCGDFNVAPEDRDVWDPEQWRGQILFSEPEKEALAGVTAWGLQDAFRLHHPEGGLYTWWDYRAGAFHRGMGLRIDHILVSPSLARRCVDVMIDGDERKGEKPSDHAPVIATIE